MTITASGHGAQYILLLLKYCLEAGSTVDSTQLIRVLQDGLSHHIAENIMTIAQPFIEQGKKEGEQKGLLKGQHTVFTHLLKRKFALSKIPPRYQAQLKQASAAQLLNWSYRVLEANTIAEVFAVSNLATEEEL